MNRYYRVWQVAWYISWMIFLGMTWFALYYLVGIAGQFREFVNKPLLMESLNHMSPEDAHDLISGRFNRSFQIHSNLPFWWAPFWQVYIIPLFTFWRMELAGHVLDFPIIFYYLIISAGVVLYQTVWPLFAILIGFRVLLHQYMAMNKTHTNVTHVME